LILFWLSTGTCCFLAVKDDVLKSSFSSFMSWILCVFRVFHDIQHFCVLNVEYFESLRFFSQQLVFWVNFNVSNTYSLFKALANLNLLAVRDFSEFLFKFFIHIRVF
jgi:hypothetical protein